MPTRIYIVTNIDTGKSRLVDATTASTARAHVAKSLLDARVATTKEAVQLLSFGATVERAAVEAAPTVDDGPVDATTQRAQRWQPTN